ncbi:MAG: type II toxin-antitoxin system VapC family toxin [Roseiarcus sp.]
MYLIDTNVVSESRKRGRANSGVIDFFERATLAGQSLFFAAVSLGELRRGVEIIRYRGDAEQAHRLETWLNLIVRQYENRILPFDVESAQMWGRLRVPNPDDAIDKQIAAIALVNNLTVVTRNTRDFLKTGVKVLNPFSAEPSSA